MSSFAIEVWYELGSKCTLYTVRWEDEDASETDKFFQNHRDTYIMETKELAFILTQDICSEYGAEEFFFNRDEGLAQALPPKTPNHKFAKISRLPKDFPLRLFCLKLSDRVVVLFNGGVKESQVVQDSPKLYPYFKQAQIFAKRLSDEFRSGMIIENTIVEGGKEVIRLTDFSGNTEITL